MSGSLTNLELALADWITYGNTNGNATTIQGLLGITDNASNANTLQAGSGLDLFFATYPKDKLNAGGTEVLN